MNFRESNTKTYIVQILVALYLIFALLIAVRTLFLTAETVQTPSLNFFWDSNMRYYQMNAVEDVPENLQFLDSTYKIAGIDQHTIQTGYAIHDFLKTRQIGDEVSVAFIDPEGSVFRVPVILEKLNPKAVISFFYLPLSVGFIFLICAFWVFFLFRNKLRGLAFANICSSMSIIFVLYGDTGYSHYFAEFVYPAVVILSFSLIHFSLELAKRQWNQNLKKFIIPFYSFGFILLVLFWLSGKYLVYMLLADIAIFSLLAVALICFVIILAIQFFKADTTFLRYQAGIILLSGLIAFIPAITISFLKLSNPFIVISSWMSTIFLIFPIATILTLSQHHIPSRSISWFRFIILVFASIIVAFTYTLIVTLLNELTAVPMNVSTPWVSGGLILIIIIVIDPIRRRVISGLNDRIFGKIDPYQDSLRKFSQNLVATSSQADLTRLVFDHIYQNLHPAEIHMFIYNPIAELYTKYDHSGRVNQQITFLRNSEIIQTLTQLQTTITFKNNETFNLTNPHEKGKVLGLNAVLFIPLHGTSHLVGFFALGKKENDESYTPNDLLFLETICNQTAIATERLNSNVQMQKYITELEIMSQISSWINTTSDPMVFLDNLYAKISLLLPVDYFCLVAYEEEIALYRYIMLVKNGRRMQDMENQYVLEIPEFEKMVFEQEKFVLTHDLEKFSLTHQLNPPVGYQLFNMMGLPIIANNQLLGVLCVGSSDPRVHFNSTMINQFQSIANQTAGAMLKFKLLEHAELRSNQLATLNQITRQLTRLSHLENFFEDIIYDAMQIIHCEAGSLLLPDEEGMNLYFKVVTGPVAEQLLNVRMPAHVGHAGKAFSEGTTVIVNDVSLTREWFSKTDEKTGYSTRSLIAVPLIARDKVIGVLELVNKLDGLPFSENDKSLMEAFAAQASIAFENARLYTQTDQALEEKLNELSVLQKVDRQLNASLDVLRTSKISLDWAMNHFQTESGLIGMLVENRLLINSCQGYPDEDFINRIDALDVLDIQITALNDPVIFRKTSDAWRAFTNNPDTNYQWIFPITYENQCIGMIILESSRLDEAVDKKADFIGRFCDHAAIALANAQLYETIQQANLAKSEFISFISHELKNPMTSIKGYSEMLAAGKIGDVNEKQANTLQTIRANIDRMAQLVSETADHSRIEAGQIRLNLGEVNVLRVIEEVLPSFTESINKHGLALLTELPATCPSAWADQTRLNQILTNLLSNAIKYTPAGGQIKLTLVYENHSHDASKRLPQLHFIVADNGYGIRPEDKPYIFTKFFRSDDPRIILAHGTGLGLNIARSLVEMQGGTIWFESQPDEGSEFHFTLPAMLD